MFPTEGLPADRPMPPERAGNGWDSSAHAWIAEMGHEGDFVRQHILDEPILARIRLGGFRDAIDFGCGEGRLCRKLQKLGLKTIGLDPTQALLGRARQLDPHGAYILAGAERTGLADGCADLAVAYLSLIDIPDLAAAVAEMVRVVRPGGSLLIANLQAFVTASKDTAWAQSGETGSIIPDRYREEHMRWRRWHGIEVQSWHRPLETYFNQFLAAGLQLRHFAEPAPSVTNTAQAGLHQRIPMFVIMEWQKPLVVSAPMTQPAATMA